MLLYYGARSRALFFSQTVGAGGDIGRVDERAALHRANMLALSEEEKGDEPRYVVLWFAGPGGTEVARNVHAPIAAAQSELVSRCLSTLVGAEEVGNVGEVGEASKSSSLGRHLKVDVASSCRDETTLDALVAWMYGADPHDEADPWTLGDAVKLLCVSRYMRMHGLQSRCSKYIEDWADLDGICPADVSVEDVSHLRPRLPTALPSQ